MQTAHLHPIGPPPGPAPARVASSGAGCGLAPGRGRQEAAAGAEPLAAAPRPGTAPPGEGDGGEAAVGHATEAATAEATELRVPRLFKVILHNDDYTTMEFVVMCLMRVFHRSEPEAVNIMLAIHKQGAGVAGTYSFEVAEARQQKVSRMAREHEYPLKCTLEPA